jgi:hypothetical protein
MKRLLLAAAFALSAPALATDVGVSITIGQPGFYGHIDIGDFPPPRFVYPEPLIIERGPFLRPPVYLHVPPGHAKNWRKYCGKYNACGERVYFVRDDWYQNEYVPRYQEKHRGHSDSGKHGNGNGNGNSKHDKGNKGQGNKNKD